jgi:hypothetical protein
VPKHGRQPGGQRRRQSSGACTDGVAHAARGPLLHLVKLSWPGDLNPENNIGQNNVNVVTPQSMGCSRCCLQRWSFPDFGWSA